MHNKKTTVNCYTKENIATIFSHRCRNEYNVVYFRLIIIEVFLLCCIRLLLSLSVWCFVNIILIKKKSNDEAIKPLKLIFALKSFCTLAIYCIV